MTHAPKAKRRVAITVRVSRDLANQMKTLVRDYAGKPYYLTQQEVVEVALTEYIEKFHQRGTFASKFRGSYA